MVYTEYTKQRIIYFLGTKGYKYAAIVSILREEGLSVSQSGVGRLIKKYQATSSIARLPGSGRPSKITPDILQVVEYQMRHDEMTATQLHHILQERGHCLSFQTILNARERLGWTYRGSAYCQIIRQNNKVKRMDWAQEHKEEVENGLIDDVLWTDEASIMMECHRRFCWHKSGTQPKPKPRPKHPTKVHVWAGISCQGKTRIIIFDGIMNAAGFIEVLEAGLLPYMKDINANVRLMQDNDPKHTSNRVRDWLETNGVNWWKTPPESPDLNPIENMWHELKEYLRREVKPTVKSELIDGINQFWDTVTIEKCTKYIYHLKKVVPKVRESNGGPTGF